MIGLPGGMLGVNITITVTGCRAWLALVNWVNSELPARLRVRFTRDLFGSPRMRNRTTNDCEIAAVKKRDTGECLSRFTRRRLHNVCTVQAEHMYSLRVYNRSLTPERSSIIMVTCFVPLSGWPYE